MKLKDVCGNVTTDENFWFNLFGIPLQVSVHSRSINPPELRQNMESISRVISNSAKLLTQASCLYVTSYLASMNFSIKRIPECAKMILLKLMIYPFCNLMFTTLPAFPIIITYPSLSFYSIVSPGLVMIFSQE